MAVIFDWIYAMYMHIYTPWQLFHIIFECYWNETISWWVQVCFYCQIYKWKYHLMSAEWAMRKLSSTQAECIRTFNIVAGEWYVVKIFTDEQDSVPSATVPSQWSAVASGTLFLIPSPLLHVSLSSGHASNHTCLNGHSRLTVTDTYLQCLHLTVGQSFSSF